MHEPPKRALQRLLYVSRARDDTLQNMAAVFPQILSASQSINAKREITGCLLACNGWFMQILEGPGFTPLTPRSSAILAITMCRSRAWDRSRRAASRTGACAGGCYRRPMPKSSPCSNPAQDSTQCD